MNWTVLVSPRAEQDIVKAQLWYEERQPGLGDRFIQEIDHALTILKEDADRFPTYYRRFRRVLLPRFPYKIFFVLEKDRVLVFRILHVSRKHQWMLS